MYVEVVDYKMAGSSVLNEGEFGYLLNRIDFDEEFVNESKNCVSEIEVSSTFSCSFCCKTFTTYRGLTQHMKTKHADASVASSTTFDLDSFGKLCSNSLKKLADDETLPKSVLAEYEKYALGTDEVSHAFIL